LRRGLDARSCARRESRRADEVLFFGTAMGGDARRNPVAADALAQHATGMMLDGYR
jgi:hypothetical protein